MTRRIVPILAILLVAAVASVPVMAKTSIHLVTYGADTVFDRWNRIAKAFNEANPDYELEVQIYTYAEYISKVTLMILAGSPPDIMMTWAEYKPAWIEQGIVKDITEYWEKSDIAREAQIFPFMLESAMHEGRFYGIPHDYSFMSWILNQDRLDNAGLPTPDSNWTVDDFANYAMRLTSPNEGVYGASLSGHWALASWQWAVNANGQGWLSDDRTEILVNQPEHVAMLEMWQELITREAVPLRGTTPPAGDGYAGGYAMWEGWVHYASRMNASPYRWTMATMPKGQAGNLSLAQGHMWSVPSNAPNPDASWVFLEWALSPEGQRTMVEVNGTQPLSNDPELWQVFFSTVQPEMQPFMQDFVINVVYGQNLIHNMNFWTQYADVNRIMNNNLLPVFRLETAPGPAMEQAAMEIRAVMGL